MLKITLKRSVIGNTPRNRATVRALGLTKTGRSVLQEDTPTIRGMIHHVKHLLAVEVVEGARGPRKRAGLNAAQPGKEAAPAKAPKPAPADEAKEKPEPKPKPRAAPKKPAAKKPAKKEKPE